MEKLNRALLSLEDNTARIETIARRATSTVITGTAGGGVTSFGTMKADGGAVVIAFDGAACDLSFVGTTVASGTSPLFAKLTGSGELKLNGERGNARGIAFGITS